MLPATVLPAVLLARLEAIGASLAGRPDALGLIALGSSGRERERLDGYSDLDFFAIVEEQARARYLDTLDWLEAAGPIVYRFRNTVDGYKLLYADGVFCEFAVFTPRQLAASHGSGAYVVWERPGVALQLPAPPAPDHANEAAWHVDEALTNLYVGLGRLRRGERLTAARFIQHYAVDRVLALVGSIEPVGPGNADPFSADRRVEQRYPFVAHLLPQFVQGYEQSSASALAILAFLEAGWEVNPQLAAAIRERAAAEPTPSARTS